MSIAFRAAGVVSAHSGDGSLPDAGGVALPVGVQIGDRVLLVVWTDAGTLSITTNGGGEWTAVSGSPWGTTEKLYIWSRAHASGDSNPTLTISGTVFAGASAAATIAYSGVSSSSPIDAVGTASSGSGTAVSNGGVTTTTPNAVAIHAFGIGDNGSASGWTFNGSATGVTERLDVSSSQGNDSQLGAADLLVVSPGATGTAAATASLTSPWVSVTLAIAEPGASTAVGADLGVAWTVRRAIAATLAVPSTVRQAIAATAALPWTVRQAAGASVAVAWTDHAQAGADLAAPWTVRSAVAADAALEWLLREQAGADLELPWGMAGGVGVELAAAWTVLATAGRDAELSWVTRAVAATGRPAIFVLTGCAQARFDIRGVPAVAFRVEGHPAATLDLS